MSAPDPLARALLPVLLHRLGNATQLLTGMNAMLGLEGGDELFSARSADLADTSTSVDRLGWALAVIGSGTGAELLLERRDPRGLEILLDLVGDATRRGDGAHVVAPKDLPRLTPGTLGGWQLPWAIASLVHAAASARASGTLDWSLEPCDSGGWRLTVPGGEALVVRAAEVMPHLPGAEWSFDAGVGVLSLPGSWLAAAR